MPRRRYNFEVTYAKKKIYIKKKNIAKLIKICTHHTRISSQWLLCIKTSRGYIIYPNIIFIRERERERFKFSDHEWQERGKKWNKNTLRTNVSRDILHHSYIRIRPMYVLYIHTYTEANGTNFIKPPPTRFEELIREFTFLTSFSSSLNFHKYDTKHPLFFSLNRSSNRFLFHATIIPFVLVVAYHL